MQYFCSDSLVAVEKSAIMNYDKQKKYHIPNLIMGSSRRVRIQALLFCSCLRDVFDFLCMQCAALQMHIIWAYLRSKNWHK